MVRIMVTKVRNYQYLVQKMKGFIGFTFGADNIDSLGGIGAWCGDILIRLEA